MLVELNKRDFTNLLKGTTPHVSIFGNTFLSEYGKWDGGILGKWVWSHKLTDLTEEELYELYKLCVTSHEQKKK